MKKRANFDVFLATGIPFMGLGVILGLIFHPLFGSPLIFLGIIWMLLGAGIGGKKRDESKV